MIDFEFWESIAMTEMVALMGQLINQKQYLNYDVIFIFKIKMKIKINKGAVGALVYLILLLILLPEM